MSSSILFIRNGVEVSLFLKKRNLPNQKWEDKLAMGKMKNSPERLMDKNPLYGD